MKISRIVSKFSSRHIGITTSDRQYMLNYMGYDKINKLINDVNPNCVKHNIKEFEPRKENEMLDDLNKIMKYNKPAINMIGLGYNDSILPNPIKKHILQNPKWYTAYTPYQPEISQGRLESQYNYQTMIESITGLDISNASLLDESSTISEVVNMFRNYTRKKKNTVICCDKLHPHIIHTLQTKCKVMNLDLKLVTIKELDTGIQNNTFGDDNCNIFDNDVMGVIFSYPDTYGNIFIPFNLIEYCKKENILLCSNNDLLSLICVKTPGELGIDISFGTVQRFGMPLWFGGPHPSFLASNEKLLRYLPGRIIGKSIDSLGEPAYRLGLQTREQHIRRDKATSNICTSQSLLANVASFYSIYHGPEGLRKIHLDIAFKTMNLASKLKALGFNIINNSFFDTITIEFDKTSSIYANEINELLRNNNILIRKENDIHSKDVKLILSVNEKTSHKDLIKILGIFKNNSVYNNYVCDYNYEIGTKYLPEHYERKTYFLEQEVFNKYQSETELMRYIYRLMGKDYTLCEGSIPLGSCTMKLNSATQLEPLVWDNVMNVHPFSPIANTEGYRNLIIQTGSLLKNITGLDNVSFQSNSGAMGEYSGLLCIKSYHENNGNSERNICLIPNSAHGTNFASANLVNMKIETFDDALFEDDFDSFVEKYKDNLSCLMITYPGTNGTFQNNIKEICDIVHNYGGMVYMDGANMNAQVGLTAPGVCGADVCHLNIHKTFCIPHGGGGPGMGPILCNDKLAPFLPTNIIQDEIYNTANYKSYGSITSSNWSSASLLTIPYLYILGMGSEGLREATETAILNANYLKEKLKTHYTIIDVNEYGMVGHEFIIDTSEFGEFGITELDISKRLIDYSFHPPTMSWPRKNVLMFEPTESESLEELDRLVTAMISIREEIREIQDGNYTIDDNVLKNAPHPIKMIMDWKYPYPQQKAFYPVDGLLEYKFWPSVARLDDVYGDKHIMKLKKNN